MVAVGFSAGYGQGIWCIIVYFLVHNIDAYVVVPFVARRTVDLAPAVLFAMQLLMAALFGISGVLFADPILATLKVVLVDLSRQQEAEEGEGPDIVDGRPVTAAGPAAPAAPVATAAEQRRAAGHDLPHRTSKLSWRPLGEALRARHSLPSRALRDGEAVLTAFLHPRHRLGEPGIDMVHRKWLGAAMAFAVVDDRAVIAGENIVHQCRVGSADRRSAAVLHDPELEAARGHRRP